MWCIRKQKATYPNLIIRPYAPSTSTTGLRKHLADRHLNEWVDSCDEHKIKINGNTYATQKAAQYREKRDGMPQDTSSSTVNPTMERLQFSNEAFVDALTDFIVSDDQVSTKL